MPRSRPSRVRAGVSRPRAQRTSPVIDGLSARALSEIDQLERSRNYLQPGDVSAALSLWKRYVQRPERQLWHDVEWGDPYEECCGSPLQARALLDTVTRAMSPRGARELRRIIGRSDAVWNQPTPPYGAD